ncbi:TIGR00341 family protein [Halobaculum limi]|uniref:TIGR00341 family protein n=1 Tax=Halobaculum limi TaxID=3031916 RepID=UPI002406E186|nr:TIGR00341 family protein [Halobaculum sp. YSMS11]
MRLVRTLVPADAVAAVEEVLDGYDIDHVVVKETGGDDDRVLVEFPVPTQAVESVLEAVREAAGDDAGHDQEGRDAYTVVTAAESVFAPHVDELEERFVTGDEEDDSIPTEEVRSTALDLTPSPVTYYAMTALSAVVATAGLLLDSPAIVVGSMVIAPLVGSALTASVGTVLDERPMLKTGLSTQLLGLALAVAVAAAFSFALKSAAFLPPALDVTTTRQIASRVSPGLLSVVVGVCAGAAGAVGLATGVSVALVGVMVAAALVPAAAAVGIGIAWGLPSVAFGALLLLVLNVIAIHLAAAGVLWILGYRPTDWTAGEDDRISPSKVASLVAVAFVLATAFVGTAAVAGEQVAFERQANGVVADVLDRSEYSRLELVSVDTSLPVPAPISVGADRTVSVVVARPADTGYPDLARTIAAGIDRETGHSVTVTVEYVDRQRYPAKTSAMSSSRVGTRWSTPLLEFRLPTND